MRPGLLRKVTNLDLACRSVQLAVAEELAPLAARGYTAKRNSTTCPHLGPSGAPTTRGRHDSNVSTGYLRQYRQSGLTGSRSDEEASRAGGLCDTREVFCRHSDLRPEFVERETQNASDCGDRRERRRGHTSCLDEARHARLAVQSGSTLRNLGRLDEAIAVLQSAPTHESTGSVPRVALALTRHNAGRK